MSRKIIIDIDPGIDDTVAILFALYGPVRSRSCLPRGNRQGTNPHEPQLEAVPENGLEWHPQIQSLY